MLAKFEFGVFSLHDAMQAEYMPLSLDSSAVVIAQLAHAAGESILCREVGDEALRK